MATHRDGAVAAHAQRAAERDQIQANLLELDASFGKRLLEGPSLTGTTKVRWQSASADLEDVWAIFPSYAQVVQRVGEMLDRNRFPSAALLSEVSQLLTGPAVHLTGRQVPLAERILTASAQPEERVTLATAVQRMTAAFGRVTEVVGAAERVWNEASERLDHIESVLSPALRQAEGVADDAVLNALAAADTELRRLRRVVSDDPLSLWHGDGVDTTALEQLERQARAAVSRAAEVAQLMQDADRRIAETAARVATAMACESDAAQTIAEAVQKIAASKLPASPPATTQLTSRLAGLDAIKAAGRWRRMAAELEAIDGEAAAAAARWQEAGRAAQALLNQRSELRGLLDAYRAKAAGLGAAESIELAALYQRARDLLRAAPCDLLAAGDAVRRYQQAVLGLPGGTP